MGSSCGGAGRRKSSRTGVLCGHGNCCGRVAARKMLRWRTGRLRKCRREWGGSLRVEGEARPIFWRERLPYRWRIWGKNGDCLFCVSDVLRGEKSQKKDGDVKPPLQPQEKSKRLCGRLGGVCGCGGIGAAGWESGR